MAHACRQPPERPTRDLDGVRIGWEREGERGRRRNVYTGLVGQSFLLRRSFAKAQTVFNEIISHERGEKGEKKKEKKRERQTPGSTRDSHDDRSNPRFEKREPRCFSLVSRSLYSSGIRVYRIVSYRTVSLLPRTSSASGVPVAKREEQPEERRRKLDETIVVLFVVVHGSVSGPAAGTRSRFSRDFAISQAPPPNQEVYAYASQSWNSVLFCFVFFRPLFGRI